MGVVSIVLFETTTHNVISVSIENLDSYTLLCGHPYTTVSGKVNGETVSYRFTNPDNSKKSCQTEIKDGMLQIRFAKNMAPVKEIGNRSIGVTGRKMTHPSSAKTAIVSTKQRKDLGYVYGYTPAYPTKVAKNVIVARRELGSKGSRVMTRNSALDKVKSARNVIVANLVSDDEFTCDDSVKVLTKPKGADGAALVATGENSQDDLVKDLTKPKGADEAALVATGENSQDDSVNVLAVKPKGADEDALVVADESIKLLAVTQQSADREWVAKDKDSMSGLPLCESPKIEDTSSQKPKRESFDEKDKSVKILAVTQQVADREWVAKDKDSMSGLSLCESPKIEETNSQNARRDSVEEKEDLKKMATEQKVTKGTIESDDEMHSETDKWSTESNNWFREMENM